MAATFRDRRTGADAGAAGAPRLYVVRSPGAIHGYEWQIRKFGSVILTRGDHDFTSEDEARAAGEIAFAEFQGVP